MPGWLTKAIFPLKRRDLVMSWVMGLGALVFYIVQPVRIEGYDTLLYSIDTVSKIASQHFHPHHLLFSRTIWLLLNFSQIFSDSITATQVMAWLDTILAVLGVVIFYRCAVMLSGQRLVAFLITIYLAVCWSYHQFATIGETVIPEDVLLLLAIYLALDYRDGTIKRLVFIGIITGLAILYHQISVLYLPFILVLLVFGSQKGHFLRRSLIFLVSSAGFAGLIYLIVMVLYYGLWGFGSWWGFLTYMAQFNQWGKGNPADIISGIGYLLNSGGFVFSIHKARGDERNWVFIGQWLILVPAIFVLVMTILRGIKKEWFGVIGIVSLILATGFINWWDGPTIDFWVFPWMLLLLLLAWASRGRMATILSVWLLLAIPAEFTLDWNFHMSFFTDKEANFKKRAMTILLSRVDSQTTVMVSDDGNIILRSLLAKMRTVDYATEKDNLIKAANEFADLALRQKEITYRFVITDVLYGNYSTKIRPYLATEQVGAFDQAFTKAIPLVDIDNKWKIKFAIWLLGPFP